MDTSAVDVGLSVGRFHAAGAGVEAEAEVASAHHRSTPGLGRHIPISSKPKTRT